ncbi:DUF1176 domain-containing protein [Rhizobium sp. AQ_MP]|uniref:DUF1176 domain-containing protein n=1 Tax=Rhizobium sp. AQ_MP TaxID=2761536 RepID=UPI00163B4F1E|nr:DUF1176 domain-containing protein [Rhizobium sp. AQ_MP]MBC2773363.1 DUF1176 domain-containing protein [Rhizobium sp. AQ_MP]
MKFLLLPCLAFSLLATAASSVRAEEPSIDLKLFGKHEIEGGLSTCHLAFWQSNKDPDTDKYAYLIYMPYDKDGVEMQAVVEIGKEKIALNESARGDFDPPSRLGYRLYSSVDHETHVLVRIEEAVVTGSLQTIGKATVTVVRPDLPPFVAGAKGVIGCPGGSEPETAAAPAEQVSDEGAAAGGASPYTGPVGLPLAPPVLLASTNEVPAAVRREIATYAPDQCSEPDTLAYPGQRYGLSGSFILWEVPCFLGAYQGTSIFAITQDPPSDWATMLSLPNPPALEGENNAQMMNPEVFAEKGVFLSTSLGRGEGDCGTYQVFRLMDAPGETFEFQLMEYREKIECDGVQSEPSEWPLQFSAGE